jgi:multidrug efflux pump subunit AcrA (membrane-fusion protein)
MTKWMKRGIAVAGVAIVVAGVSVGVARAQGDNSPSYRTATATLGDVEQDLTLSGTVAHPSTAKVVFTTSGTVAKVDVAAGDAVTAGQQLASLDTVALDAAVTRAEAEVASAKARLASDETAQASAAAAAAQAAKTAAEQMAAAQAAEAAAKKAQQDQQQAAQAVQHAIESLAQTCGADTATAADCTSAQNQAQQALSTLEKLYSQQSASSPGGDSSTASSGSSDNKPGGATVTTATLDSDKAQIARGESDLVAAQQARADAVVVAPVTGAVVTVSVAAGDSAAAGTPAFTVIGEGLTTVDVAADVTKTAEIKAGQKVTVSVLGQTKTLSGKVTAVGLLPSSTSTGTTTYPVTITLDDGSDLATGVTVSATIVIGTASQVITVPVSAVTNGAVKVLEGNSVTTKKVTVGLIGGTRVQVDGIAEGATVVLADVTADLPSNDNTRGLTGGGFNGPPAGVAPPGGTGGGRS